jgi:hypothetical protein
MSDAPGQGGGRRVAGTWIGLALAAIVTAVITCVVDWLVIFGQSSTCHETPDPGEIRSGRITLFAVLVVAALPWSLGALMSRNRVPVRVTGTVAVVPALLFFVAGLSTDTWVGSFCF